MARNEVRSRMAGLLKRWRASGQSAAAFCRREGINPQKLSYWRRVLGMAEPVKRPARRHSVAGLVPVRLLTGVGAGANGPCLEIHLASGERVVFPEGGSLEALRAVVGLLRERC